LAPILALEAGTHFVMFLCQKLAQNYTGERRKEKKKKK
jgi:hypothetical protein